MAGLMLARRHPRELVSRPPVGPKLTWLTRAFVLSDPYGEGSENRPGATAPPKPLHIWQTFPEYSYFGCSLLVLN
jgi:hypothetical protein